MTKDIKTFLKLGYFLRYKNDKYKVHLSLIKKQRFKNCDKKELINLGSSILLNTIQKLFKNNQSHVVPLSGGLDSRTVLAALLTFTEAKNIYTYTFGTPGTLDFEIGNLVARNLGTNHKTFPLTEYPYTLEELIDFSNRSDQQTVLFHHPSIWELDKYYGTMQYWSGYLGDILTGGHLPSVRNKDTIDIMNAFIKKNTFVHSQDISNLRNKEMYDDIEFPELPDDKISIYEQIDFYNRQVKYIAPHVLCEGFKYNLLFLDTQVVEFFLSLDEIYRKNQCLYKEILLTTFPEAFCFPTKNTLGLKLDTPQSLIFLKKIERKLKQKFNKYFNLLLNEYINYLDFNKEIRENNKLRDLIRANIEDLKIRNLIDWLDPTRIYQNHMNNYGNFADALLVLASLEIHMKAASDKSNENVNRFSNYS
ncbi:MAG: hypothetical protein GF317_13745 [Candidatus Lokiarchaeota archaeon]|nr:hypothetical protein [Candidatus Lokiarchaeota archaeon]